jgi:hypothetical protein
MDNVTSSRLTSRLVPVSFELKKISVNITIEIFESRVNSKDVLFYCIRSLFLCTSTLETINMVSPDCSRMSFHLFLHE